MNYSDKGILAIREHLGEAHPLISYENLTTPLGELLEALEQKFGTLTRREVYVAVAVVEHFNEDL